MLPASFEFLEEVGFDFGCDVAVDLDQPVGQVMAEAFGLGDFRGDVAVDLDQPVGQMVAQPAGLSNLGNAVSDEPGLVAVP